MTRFLARILGIDGQMRAQIRLEQIVQATRDSEAIRSYRKHRAAALKGLRREA